jgi:hypothetical protein
MSSQLPAIPERGKIAIPTTAVQPNPADGARSFATRDHDVIRAWASRHGAEPATGEATASGPATLDVRDGGAGIRFNFPGMARFRPIAWNEWFDHFERHRLVFVYDEEVADRAYALWQRRGAGHGQDRQDWFDAERDLNNPGISGAKYRLLQQDRE